MFQDRQDAARQLADRLRARPWRAPLVLGIPRGGMLIGAVIAREIGADLDVALARKLRAPAQPELALGAVSESGEVYLNTPSLDGRLQEYLDREKQIQLREIARRRRLLRGDRSPVPTRGRSVIVVDDGIATGSTMIAALQSLRNQEPYELIVAVPVGAPDRLRQIRPLCDELICLREEPELHAIGQFYDDFRQLDDEEVVALLEPFQRAPADSIADHAV